MGAGGLSSPCYLVEWYRPVLSGAQMGRAAATIEACAAAVATSDSHVRLLGIVALPADEVVFGIFLADTDTDVTEVCRQAGMTAQRVTAALGFGGTAGRTAQ
jgi:hypothetical protein